MQPSQPLILLIDGNNLAHFLYTNLVPGQKMTPADGQRLVEHIGSYARSYPAELSIELFLDRSPGGEPAPVENLRILFAEYPQTADDLLLDRFWFHHQVGRLCLVITNDEAILEEVRAARGFALRVYDYVRRPGLVTPVFRAPDELPAVSLPPAPEREKEPILPLGASIYFRIAQEEAQPGIRSPEASTRRAVTAPARAARLPDRGNVIEKTAAEPGSEPAFHSREDEGEEDDCASNGSTAGSAITEPAGEGPYYFLTIENWPIEEGVRFLLNSFCPQHRAEYQDLLAEFDLAALRHSDLRALAELLLHACGGEPGFAHRGALMARVRLALLQARGEPLSLEDLAARTDLKVSGLRGRIKAKAGRWVAIL